MFCVYLTIYMGNKMPMFYIGSSSLSKVIRGYHGSVSSKLYKDVWKSELKNNPELFKTRIISVHTDRLSALDKENKFHKHLSVVRCPLYLNLSNAIPDGCFGNEVKGENNPMYGKKRPDAVCRMVSKNPMFCLHIARKVTEKKRLLRESGMHKTTKNKEETIRKTKERMSITNPSKIRCCCLVCRKETIPSALVRFHNH